MAPRKEVLAEGVRRDRRPRPSMLKQDVVTIYALRHPLSGEIRYVGKTHYTTGRRLTYHLQACKHASTPLAYWLRGIVKHKLRPEVVELEQVPPGQDWVARERHWIAHYRGVGSMLNLTAGGEGLGGYTPTKFHRERIAASLRTGSHRSCRQCGTQFWRKLKDIKRGHDKFCSRPCYAAFLVGVPLAERREALSV